MDKFSLAIKAWQVGQVDLTAHYLQAVLAHQPAHFEALHLLAVTQLQTGNAAAAVENLMRAAKLKPREITVQLKLASALRMVGRLLEAEVCLRKLLKRENSNTVRMLLAGVCKDLGKLSEAEKLYRLSLQINPNELDAWFNLGTLLLKQLSFAEAVTALQKAVALQPDDYQAWANLGEALHRQQRYNDAESAYVRALAIRPDIARVWKMRAALRLWQGDAEGVEQVFRNGLQALPHDSRLELGLALHLLAREHWKEGWQHYLYRNDYKYGHVSSPPQSVTNWHGKTVVLLFDQGLGDELMFLRFAPTLQALGAEVIYYAPTKLVKILQGHPALNILVAEGETVPTGTLGMNTSDLPLMLGITQSADIPRPLSLEAEASLKQQFQQVLNTFGAPPYIGVTWEGGKRDDDYAMNKSLAPNVLGNVLNEALKNAPGTLVLLQRNPDPADVAQFEQAAGRRALDLTATNEELQDMLAVLDLLDDYVGVSNTNMHLRASLGKTARVLLPYPPEWRWLAEDKPTPWMPGFKTYRQDRKGNWEAALAALHQDLQAAYGKSVEGG